MIVGGPVRTLVWRRLPSPGAEYFALARDGEGWRLAGTVVASVDAEPLLLAYEIRCDARWRTRDVRVHFDGGERTADLHLKADGEGAWRRNGEPLPEVQGCLDVDIVVTPATNTLPIRRLGLGVGESADVTAAWVGLPGLAVEPLPQRYTRRGDREYGYESDGGAFTAALTVDDLGLVTHYSGGWERG